MTDRREPRVALTIAGSDSSGGAGIQADLKTFAALGVYGTSAVTAVTAQNTIGCTAVHALPSDFVIAQIEAVAADIPPHVTKTGMLATTAIVEAVAAVIEELELPNVVVDPVLVASSGERLLDEDGLQALRNELLPRARVVTPNIPEAEALTGRRIRSLSDRAAAAREIHRMGPTAVLVKGGHAAGDTVVDLLFDGDRLVELATPRVSGPGAHGTGCTLAAAVAAYLALGHPLDDAARRAQAYVAGAIRQATALGKGPPLLDHFWQSQK